MACGRLRRLARGLLRGDRVARWTGSDDLVQEAVVRVRRELEQVRPQTIREFLGLAAFHLKRELKRLARHYFGPQGLGANHASDLQLEANGHAWVNLASASGTEPCQALERQEELQRLHEAIERLPDELQEVVEMVWLNGLSILEAAEILGVTDRTVRNRWVRARLQLHAALRDAESCRGTQSMPTSPIARET